MLTLGICVGSSTLSLVELYTREGIRPSVVRVSTDLHHGNPSRRFLEQLAHLEPHRFDRIAVTGRSFRHSVNLSALSEPEAVELAIPRLGDGRAVNVVVSAGGETFIAYLLGKNGAISSIQSGNKCASGTGEFFLQQVSRMGLSPEEALSLARREQSYQVSGRCSVFCKSDCTHALNKGIPKGRVVAGLCRMMAGKVLEIIKQGPRENIMLIGGCSRNDVMVDFLRHEVRGLVVPDEAPYCEALGAALWAVENETIPFPGMDGVLKMEESRFYRLTPIGDAGEMVQFKEAPHGEARPGDECIIGLDVGSTTTKAVLMRLSDDRIVASVYLRTQGDPVGAARRCYAALADQLAGIPGEVSITGLGVTGSGRQIAGLHAMSEGIINEIIAHATGALYFDGDVDTIFEIGGQDAKYTWLTNGVPSDYAMNEACSAGTGSFLEEAAWETLAVSMEDIADSALRGMEPPNFNDQCAAFIGSDIKSAAGEGISRDDILAGLVYSICMNYNFRVRGGRPAGKKIFMQGGVCYNRAVPMAMAVLTGAPIVVPPDPGLIGAFGVALEVKQRQDLGLLEKTSFSLDALHDREIEYKTPFVCKGEGEACDRKCEVARIRIDGATYPFGGACNRWYNLRRRIEIDTGGRNLAAFYEACIFDGRETASLDSDTPAIGMNKSFMVNSYYPLYRRFFESLGFRVVLSRDARQEGMDRKNAPFCYPAEIAHGFFQDLLEQQPDYLFLPQFKADYVPGVECNGIVCPLCQGEPYYLASAFKDHALYRELKDTGRILDPVIDFSADLEAAEPVFVSLGRQLGRSGREARRAFRDACSLQRDRARELRDRGRQALRELDESPGEIGVVLFGRSYNAFVSEANMGIPNKFASRGIRIIPLACLDAPEDCYSDDGMYWASGQRILAAARLVKGHSRLFGCFITNFSCGPDSFLLGSFRDIMGRKPSLTLELDSHVADAGLETRIEAFLDIIDRYRKLDDGASPPQPASFRPAEVISRNGEPFYIDSRGNERSLFDEDVHLLFPSMCRFLSEAGSAVFRGFGVVSTALPPPDDEILRVGRAHTTCKECLPLLLTAGGLVHYMEERKRPGEKLIYFMPTAGGPCRFGQYSVFLRDLVQKQRMEDTAIYSLNAENSYADLGARGIAEALWQAVIVADIFEEIYSVVLANAVDVDAALDVFDAAWRRVIAVMETRFDTGKLEQALKGAAADLAAVPLRRSLDETPVILLAGEIYVRHDDISRQYLLEELARRGFAVKVASLAEWIYYTGWCVQKKVSTGAATWKDRLALRIRTVFMKRREKSIRTVMAQSGLCTDRCEAVEHVLDHTLHLMKPDLTGEAILTIGTSINEVVDHYCGVIAIGPFGCMPNRLAEAVLAREMNLEGKRATGAGSSLEGLAGRIDDLPFLAVESDGSRFPQLITARLEAFTMQAKRLFALQQELGRWK